MEAEVPPWFRSSRFVGQGRNSGAELLLAAAVAAVDVLAEAEDHELRRLDRADADLADDLPGLDDLRRVGLGVALHEERLVRRGPEQHALAPHVRQEVRDRRAQL